MANAPTAHRKNILTTIRRSFAYSIAGTYFALPLQIIGTMVMSRLLTPAETGVFAVAAVFAAFASTFRDFGVAEYLIQEKNVTSETIRAALTVNIAVSWVMGLLLFFLAPVVAEYYRNKGIADVMHVQAISFLAIPFGAVTMANFRRQLDFRPIFWVGLWSGIASFSTAISCAFYGLGYMSLAWATLIGTFVSVGGSIWFRPKGFPKWPGLAGVGKVIHFGKFASGIYIFGQIGKGAPEMIIGRAQDLTGVAMFSRGYGLIELFNRSVLNAISPVCLPYFAKGNHESGSVVNGYLKSVMFVTAIGWPFFAFVGAMAFAAIRIFYGGQWLAAVPLTQILCVVAGIELTHHFAKEALIATGSVNRSNTLQIWHQSTRILGLLLVIPFGLTGACFGLLIAALIGITVSHWNLKQAIALSWSDMVKSCVPSALTAAFSVLPIAIWVALYPVDETNYFVVSAFGGISAFLIWLLSLRLLKHPLWDEILVVWRKVRTKI
jgi:O-antigen/teichoic acid export membrane protein